MLFYHPAVWWISSVIRTERENCCDELESHPVAAGKPAFDAWRYKYIAGVGTNVIVEFVDTTGSGDYRMSMDPNPSKK